MVGPSDLKGTRRTLRQYQSPRRSRVAGPMLGKLDGLSISDLKKLRKLITDFSLKSQQTIEVNLAIREENKRLKAHNIRTEAARQAQTNEWEIKSGYRRLNQDSAEIRKKIVALRTNAITGAFTSTREFEGIKVKAEPARELIQQYERLEAQVTSLIARRPEPTGTIQSYQPEKRGPAARAHLTVAGVRMQVWPQALDLSEIETRIREIETKAGDQREHIQQLRERAARSEAETRNLARRHQRQLSQQTDHLDCCPYCGGRLAADNSHLDHIHPVSKGGQSVGRNLLFVCSSCNLKKGSTTLGLFMRAENLSVHDVHARLLSLGKDF